MDTCYYLCNIREEPLNRLEVMYNRYVIDYYESYTISPTASMPLMDDIMIRVRMCVMCDTSSCREGYTLKVPVCNAT
jgi:hypothetical protein